MKEKRFSAGKFIVYLILIFWALTTIYPLAWVFLNSFKDKKADHEQFLCPAYERPFYHG